jgi:uncharacterized protein
MKTDAQTILLGIKKAVLEVIPDAGVILFGSRARNEQKQESDWDILVLTGQVVDEQLKRKVRDRLFYEGLEKEICISSLIFNRKEWSEKFNRYPLFFEISKDGITV